MMYKIVPGEPDMMPQISKDSVGYKNLMGTYKFIVDKLNKDIADGNQFLQNLHERWIEGYEMALRDIGCPMKHVQEEEIEE